MMSAIQPSTRGDHWLRYRFNGDHQPIKIMAAHMSAIHRLTDDAVVRSVKGFFQRPDIYRNLERLRRRLPASARLLIAGGAIRNLIITCMHGCAPATRDIDVFIDGLPHGFSIGSVLADQQAEETELHGIRWYPPMSPLAFDLCRLADFLVIRQGRWQPNLENLLNGIDFTMNAVVFDPCRAALIAQTGCVEAIGRRLIAFNSPLIPDRRLMGYRILLMGHKTGFVYDKPVFHYVRTQLDLDGLNHLKNLFTVKHGKQQAAVIMADYDALARLPSYSAYRTAKEQAGRR